MTTSAIKNFYTRTSHYAKAHKVISAAVLVVVLGLGWWAYSHATAGSAQTKYVLGTAQKGTIIASVSGSGQVAASKEVALTGKTSGDIVSVNVVAGQEVKAGQLIAQVDATDALYDLETAQLSYDKLVTVDPDQLRSDQNALTQAQTGVTDAYTGARASLGSASTGMVDVFTGLDSLFDGYLNNQGFSAPSKGYIKTAEADEYTAQKLLKAFQTKYVAVTAGTSDADIEALVDQAYDTAFSVAQAAKAAQDAVVYARDHEDATPSANSAYTSVTGLVTKANAAVSSMSSAKSDITKSNQSLEDAQAALADLNDGPDTLDLRSEALSLQQKRDAVADASIRAPFDGLVSAIKVEKGDTVGSGSAIATILSKEQIVTLSLNEVDAAKVSAGNKATLTFDAIDGLTLTGSVAQIDAAGTVTQGVVSYAVEISFDTQDPRVKAGMTVNADIQTAAHTDVLIVPSSAVKTSGGQSYVLAFTPALADAGGTSGVTSTVAPTQIPVEVGISDDTNVEILSGLTEGEQIVTRTSTGATTAAATGATRAGAGGFGGGAGIRL